MHRRASIRLLALCLPALAACGQRAETGEAAPAVPSADAAPPPDWLDGRWRGDLHREYAPEIWRIELVARRDAASYRVRYLSLDCVGELDAGARGFADPDEPEFVQRIAEGRPGCLPPGRVRLMRGSDGQLHINYVAVDDPTHRAGGTLRRE